MKRISMFLCMAAIFFLFTGVQESHAVSKDQVALPAVKPGPPDLTATVAFADVVEYKNPKGVYCYSPRPRFTITNKGQSMASNFKYVIEWKNNPSHIWQVYTGSNPTISLGPGKTKTIDGNNAVWDQYWCVDEPDWKAGWRIQVDTTNVVEESNENNNVATKIYTHMTMPKSEPPKAIKKDYLKAPDPQSGNFNPQPEPPVEARQSQTVSPKGMEAFGEMKGLAPVEVKRSSSKPNQTALGLAQTQDVGKPSIWFDLSIQPAPKPKLNQPFSLVIGLKNIGTAANGPSNQVVVRLACKSLTKFGDCQQLLGDPVVPVIQPGQKDTLNLSYVFKITQPGTYRVSMTLDPEPTTKGRTSSLLKKSWSKEFSVSGLKKIIKPVKESKNIMPGSDKMFNPQPEPPVESKQVLPGSYKMVHPPEKKTIDPGDDGKVMPGSEKMDEEEEPVQMKKIKPFGMTQ